MKFELLNVLFSLNLNEILDLNDNTKGYCHIHNFFYSCIFFVLSNPWGTSLFTLYWAPMSLWYTFTSVGWFTLSSHVDTEILIFVLKWWPVRVETNEQVGHNHCSVLKVFKQINKKLRTNVKLLQYRTFKLRTRFEFYCSIDVIAGHISLPDYVSFMYSLESFESWCLSRY